MRSITRVLCIVLMGATAASALRGQDATSRPASSDEPLAMVREQRIPYRPMGPVVAKSKYFRGKELVGQRLFYSNGKIAEERLFRQGQPHGLMRQFYQSGKLFSAIPYEDGQLHGVARFYSESGGLLGESKIERGTGVMKQFPLSSLGLTEKEMPYRNGALDGVVREMTHWDGGKGIGCGLTQYSNGKLNGWAVTLNEDGSLLESGYFSNDQVHGVYRRWSSTGETEIGYPKFFVGGTEVTEKQYREQARSDETLAKSLNDDGQEWARKASRK